MESIPNQEPAAGDILEKIDRLRLSAVADPDDIEKIDRLNESIFHFNTQLKKRYSQEDLWATPAWHRLVGSTQQSEVYDDSRVMELTAEISDFVEKTLAECDDD